MAIHYTGAGVQTGALPEPWKNDYQPAANDEPAKPNPKNKYLRKTSPCIAVAGLS